MPKNTIATDDGNARGGKRNPLRVASSGEATFRGFFDAIALGNGKYLASIMNTSTTHDVVIQSVRVRHANLDAVTGVITEMTLRRISAGTAATAVTPLADDPETDTLPSGITLDANLGTVSDVSGGIISRFHRTGEEGILAADTLLLHGMTHQGSLVYERRDGCRGITLSGTTAANRGIAVKCETNTTAGDVNIEIEFTVEPT